MSDATLKSPMCQSQILAGTYLKMPAHDLAVCLGETDINPRPISDGMRTVAATKSHSIAAMTCTPNAAAATALIDCGMSTFFIDSNHAFALTTAKQIAADMHAIES